MEITMFMVIIICNGHLHVKGKFAIGYANLCPGIQFYVLT